MKNVIKLNLAQLFEICCWIYEKIDMKKISDSENIVVFLSEDNGEVKCGFAVPK